MSWRLLQAGVLGLCAFLLWRTVDWVEASSLLRSAQPSWLAGAVLLLTLQTALSAERWRITARQLGIALNFGHAVREYYLAQIVNQSLPGGVVGDAGRAVRARAVAGLGPSAQSVIFERLAGQVGLMTVLLLGIAMTRLAANPNGPSWLGTLASMVIGLGFLGTSLLWIPMRRFEPLRSLAVAFAHAICASNVWPRQVALNLATALCNIAAFACCAAAIGAPLDAITAITLIPIVLFAMVVPLSIAGWGLREGVAAALFPQWGSSAEAGLAASIAFGMTILVSVLPAFVLGWTSRKSRSNS